MKGMDALSTLGTGIAKLVPRGGIRHPDSVITQGPNRGLYLPSGGSVKPIPGNIPGLGRTLLTGGPRRKNYDDGLGHLRRLR